MMQNLVQHLYPIDNAYKLLTINLENEFDSFSINSISSDIVNKLNHIFQQTVSNQGCVVSASSILQSLELGKDDLNLLQSLHFTQSASKPKSGIILEHPQFPGWLIKKNFRHQRNEMGILKLNLKVVRGSDFPSWMLPEDLSNTNQISISVPNDYINPLRVVMLRRGEEWINKLNLTHIKAAKEYLYLLPDSDSLQPLYERTVVISKKENVLSPAKSLSRYVHLARSYPDKLAKIAKQIVLFIRHVKLTDNHLNNFLFLNDDTDVVVAIDGEPIGGLADAAIPDMVTAIERFDPSFWPILGLKKLQISITEQMNAEQIAFPDIKRVQDIFNKEINSAIPLIIKQRQQQLIKLQAHESLLVLNVVSYLLKSASDTCYTIFPPYDM